LIGAASPELALTTEAMAIASFTIRTLRPEGTARLLKRDMRRIRATPWCG
jgi:hypothetical protein